MFCPGWHSYLRLANMDEDAILTADMAVLMQVSLSLLVSCYLFFEVLMPLAGGRLIDLQVATPMLQAEDSRLVRTSLPSCH